jgi:SWI/SNF-related matrix-associated actin-dependent regulator 1 of chromatin subfamily A
MRLKVEPYDYQVRGIDFAFEKRYSLNGDRMGLGKSLQALGLATRAEADKVLVVCPAFLVFNWRNEIEKFLGEEHQDKFDVISYDAMTKLKTIAGYDVVAVDECHFLKNLQALRTKAFHALMEKSPPKYFIGLSGTPIKNSVPEFYSLLKLCWLGKNYPEFDMYAKSPYGFLNKFTTKKSIFFGGRQVTKYEGVRNVEGLKELIKPVYLRRRTEDVLSLPEQVFQEVLMSDRAVFDAKMKDAWENYLGGKNRNVFTSNKAVSALAKVSFTVEFVRGLLQETDRVIVFSDHVQAVKEIFSAFDVGESRYITGETTMTARAGIVQEFEAGKCKVLVATFGAMSVGVNLVSCSFMVVNDAPWVPADMAQAEARIHRIGQTKRCHYVYILASKIDQTIYRTLAAKKKLIERVGS